MPSSANGARTAGSAGRVASEQLVAAGSACAEERRKRGTDRPRQVPAVSLPAPVARGAGPAWRWPAGASERAGWKPIEACQLVHIVLRTG